jgi:hypothetical protein
LEAAIEPHRRVDEIAALGPGALGQGVKLPDSDFRKRGQRPEGIGLRWGLLDDAEDGRLDKAKERLDAVIRKAGEILLPADQDGILAPLNAALGVLPEDPDPAGDSWASGGG